MHIILLLLLFFVQNVLSYNVLHITDIHVDLYYKEGSPTQCVLGDTGMGCCRSTSIPISGSKNANKWGDSNCDAPLLFWNSTLEWVKNNYQIDLFLLTGDFVDHHDLTQTWDDNLDTIRTTSDLINLHFPNSTVIPILGNHDAYPVDQLYPGITAPSWLNSVHDIWQEWLPSNSLFKDCGYYNTTLFNNTLNMVVLNSLYYDPMNLAVKNGVDMGKCDQKKFFNSSLRNDMTNWVASHIPPGSSECSEEFRQAYHLISENTGMYQFFGHTHSDEFRAYNGSKTVGFVNPALVMGSERWPTIRVYTTDKFFNVLNYTQYHVNMTAQFLSNTFVGFEKTYDSNTYYNVDNFTNTEFYHLMNRFNSTSEEYRNYATAYNYPSPPCLLTGCFNGYMVDIYSSQPNGVSKNEVKWILFVFLIFLGLLENF